MSDKGYIKLDRKLLNWGWFRNGDMLKLWIYLLLTAKHQDVVEDGMEIKRGQVRFGRKQASKDLQISEQSIRTCINRLKSTNEITTESTNKCTLITIIKYDEYQGSGRKSTTKSTNKSTCNQPATNQQLTTYKNDKNVKNSINIYKGHSDEFVETMDSFREMRKSIKKPLTERAEQMILNRLSELATNEYQQIEILNQSIVNCWQNVYPLKVENRRSDIVPEYDTAQKPGFDEKRFEEIMKRRS